MTARRAVLLLTVLVVAASAGCGETGATGDPAAGTPVGAHGNAAASTPGSSGTSSGTSAEPSTGVGGASTTAPASRSASALASLDPARLPNTATVVASVLARLPDTVGGHRVISRGPRTVKYADGTTFTVAPLVEAAPGVSMSTFFTQFTAQPEFSVSERSAPGGELLWFVGAGSPPYRDHVAAVAATSGVWLFGMEATSETSADDLVTGFVAAVG